MADFEIVDVTDEARFALIPPCADPGFDHRTCDYWEDLDRGSRAARSTWLASSTGSAASPSPGNPFAPPPKPRSNPFAPDPGPAANPFAPVPSAPAANPFLEDLAGPLADNPFAPRKVARPAIASDAPRKLQLLGRGIGVFGSYAKVMLAGGGAVAYCQFGPLSAYPRALRLRELYPQLPDAPLPAVITCLATTSEARRKGYAAGLVAAVCDDLAGRGFSAVEAYPEAHAREDATPAASPEFWIKVGFRLAVDDDRFPVVRREL